MAPGPDAAARMRSAEEAWRRYAAESPDVHQVSAEQAWAARRDDTPPPVQKALAAAVSASESAEGEQERGLEPRPSPANVHISAMHHVDAASAAAPRDRKAADAAREAAQAARGAAAVEALRQREADARAARAARDAMSAEAAAAVAAEARRAGAHTLAEALAAFGVGARPGETTESAFRRAALRFHPDRQRAAAQAARAAGDETAALRVECTAAEAFKFLSTLRAKEAKAAAA